MQTIIESTKGWQLINLRELLRYKDLFYFLVWKEVKVLYKQTILGLTWAIIRPLATMVIFSIVFGRLAKIPSDGVPYPIFAFVALVPWTYFSTAVTSSSNSLVGNTNLLTKVYFPRLIIPMTPVLSGLIDFGIAFLILAAMMVWFKIAPAWNAVFLPFLLLLMICAASGIGMWLSALAIQYRDIKFAVPFLAQLLLYAAPVVWPVSLIPSRYRLVYGLYPMAGIIEGFRSALLGTNPMPWDLIAMGTLSTLLILLSGAFYFRKMERVFADVA
ncbi:MAG TPA: ABC transporter permease [Syntrophorhabdales bacterium]|nr:ABC transporter permease [Syntrophorhabdales bacterium]